ncbi:Hypothetical predicted protein [Cloeon dipterum]|uniref:Uncharacterized protein n=1 Tax=Cloeon dipterum TaxID=197152 RepID=A0A8S1DTV7_9INSE|nr:Hypothetical predicted protein [Cloeon dipterum]
MSFQKALCIICECPTADGAIFAVHVDKEKLQEWFLNVCGHELAEEIEDEDKICYFCAWQAEFLWKYDGMEDDDLVWWPRNLDFDDAAKELRKYYFEGIVEHCWVQLEEVNVPESEEDETEKEEMESESETHSNILSEKKICLYCGKLFKFSQHLSQHSFKCKRGGKESEKISNMLKSTWLDNVDTRRLLIEAGAVVTTLTDRFGAMALHYAALNPVHGKELVDFFDSKGLYEKKTDKRGLLPLHQTFRVKNVEAAKELLQRRRDERKHRDLLHSSVFEFAKHDASLPPATFPLPFRSGDLSEMSLQKELCLICDCPTADGAIFAVHVDKEKLQEWFLKVCGHELAEKVEDDDKICYFCAWQAEFLWKFDGMVDEDLVWWPRNLDFDDAAKELRKYYFEGIVEQCCVQLEEVDLPESEEDETDKEKALCLICERPTADGAIFAVHVDKKKLQEWFFNVCRHELAEEILDEDKICYFCAWQAEFLWKFDGMSDDDLVWWPRNLDFDDAARELRKYYFEGIVEQCWVQLEEVNLPEGEDVETEKEEAESESETHSNICSQKKICLYCDKGKMSVKISNFLQSVWLDDVDTCRRLIEAGTVVTTLTERFGAMALHYAALNPVHGKELVNFFVSKGLCEKKTDKRGLLPLRPVPEGIPRCQGRDKFVITGH